MTDAVDFPVCLRLAGRRVLVVGGGPIAQSRVEELLHAGAVVRVVAPVMTAALASNDQVERVERAYRAGDVAGHSLVMTATDDLEVSRAVSAEARALGVWVNAADLPELCDFTLPSVGRRGPITLAISTQGQAPAVAGLLRRALMRQVGWRHVQLVRLVGWLRARLPAGPWRMRFLKELVTGEAGQALLAGRHGAAVAHVRRSLQGGGA